MRCSAEIVVQTWTQLFHDLVLYSACFATKNSTINCPVLYLIWWNTRLWQLWPYSNCIHCPEMHSFTQAKITNANRLVLYHACVAAPNATTVNHVVMYWDCLRSWLNTCTLCSTVSCLFCSNKFNCKLFGCDLSWWTISDNVVVTIFSVHSLPINAQFYINKNNNCQPAITVPWVCFAERIATTASRCGDVLRLFWDSCICFAIYLCFEGINEPNPTVCFCSLSWLIFKVTMLVVIIF